MGTFSSFTQLTGKFSPSVMSSKTLSNLSAPPSIETCLEKEKHNFHQTVECTFCFQLNTGKRRTFLALSVHSKPMSLNADSCCL